MSGARTAFVRALAVVTGAAFAVRAAVVVVVMHVSPEVAPTADQAGYIALARQVAAGHGLSDAQGRPQVFRAPLYPAFLGEVLRAQRALGLEHLPPRLFPGLVQAALAAAVVALVGLLGRRRFSPAVGLAAAAIAAVWPNSVLASGNLVTETLFIPLLMAAMTLLFWWRRPPLLAAVGVGALLGAATLARPSSGPVIAVAAVVVAVAALADRSRGRTVLRAVGRAAAVVVAAVVVMAPWVWHVHHLTGLVAITNADGQDLCIGNNDQANGLFLTSDGTIARACQWPPGKVFDPKVADQMASTARSWALHHPLQELGLVPRRIAFTFLGDSSSIPNYTRDPHDLLALHLVLNAYGLPVMIAGVVACVQGIRRKLARDPAVWGLLACAASIEALVLVTYGDGRYHDPLVPFFALAVAWMVTRGDHRVARWVDRLVTDPAPVVDSEVDGGPPGPAESQEDAMIEDEVRRLRRWAQLVEASSLAVGALGVVAGIVYVGKDYTTRGWGLVVLGIVGFAVGLATAWARRGGRPPRRPAPDPGVAAAGTVGGPLRDEDQVTR